MPRTQYRQLKIGGITTHYQTIFVQNFFKTLVFSQYRCRPKIIPNSVFVHKLKKKQILRPYSKESIYKRTIEYLLFYENDYQRYHFFHLEKQKPINTGGT